MTHPLDSARLKVRRAEDHLKEIEKVMRDFWYANANGITLDPDPQTRGYIVRIAGSPRPPESLPLLIGDCVHNLRSALDHLMWQLVVANHKKPSNKTQFPVSVDSDDFWRRAGDDMAGAHPEVKVRIEALQPYLSWTWPARTSSALAAY